MEVHREIVHYLKSRHVTRIERVRGARSWTDGFVVGSSDELVAMLSIVDFRSDGLEVFPLADVERVTSSSADAFWQRVLESEGLVPRRGALRRLQIGDWPSLAHSLLQWGRMVGVSHRVEGEERARYAVGPVRDTGDERFAVQHVGPSGAWDAEWTWIRYDAVERIDIDRPYINAYERHAVPPALDEDVDGE